MLDVNRSLVSLQHFNCFCIFLLFFSFPATNALSSLLSTMPSIVSYIMLLQPSGFLVNDPNRFHRKQIPRSCQCGIGQSPRVRCSLAVITLMTSPVICLIHFLPCCNFALKNATHNKELLARTLNYHISSHLTI